MSEQNTNSPERLWTKDFILVSMTSLFTSLGFNMLLPVVPVYSAKIGGSEAWAGMVVGFFTFSAVIMRPIAGRLLDRYGRKSVFLLGLALFILCVFTYQWAATIAVLLMLRLLHGFSWGASSTASMTIATDIVPKNRMGEGIGYFGLTSTLAMAVGPAIGLGLMNGPGFKAVFDIAGLWVVIAVLAALFIRYQQPDRNGRYSKSSMIEKDAILPGAVIFLVTMSYGAIVSFIALYAAQRQIANIGLFFTVYAIALLISRPLFGRLADSKGDSYAVLPGIAAILVALLLLYFAHTLGGFIIAGFIYGLGFGASQPALQAMAVRTVSPARRGAANATFFLGFDLGIGIGSIILGAIAELTGYQYVYLCCMLPTVIAVVLYMGAKKTIKNG